MEVVVKILNKSPWANVEKWSSCYDYISSYWTRSGNVYTGLSEEDRIELEKALGYEEGTLSPYSQFWSTFAIKLGKDELVLHTQRPDDKLRYLFLKGHKRVADGMKAVNPSKDYVLINRNEEAEAINRKGKVKREAYKSFDKMSLEDMRKCLRVFGIKSDTLSNEVIEAKLIEILEKRPEQFITRWVKNDNREITYVIEEALSKNILRRSRTQYFFGTDLIGNGLDDVIAYLDNKKNQDIKMAILQELKSKK